MKPEILKKLRFLSNEPFLVLNAPAAFQGEQTAGRADGPQSRVLLFVGNQAELAEQLPPALARLAPDALFWIAYPKQSGTIRSDLNRDVLWKLVTDSGCGLRPVAQVALDETWSALRFRPAEKVGK